MTKAAKASHGIPFVTGPTVIPSRRRLTRLAKEHGFRTLPGEGSLALATRYVPGGRDGVLQYVRTASADGDPDATTWLHVWDDLKPWEQNQATFDDICAGAGVSPVKFLKIVVGIAFTLHCDLANMVAAIAHPKIVETAIESAQMPGELGFEDRRLLLQHHGFAPVPKAAVINITASASAQAAAAAATDTSVPSFAADVEEIEAPRAAVQRQLEAPAVETSSVLEADDDPADSPMAPITKAWATGSR
jgi:hypothetical protein